MRSLKRSASLAADPSPEAAPSPTDATDQTRHWKNDPAIQDGKNGQRPCCAPWPEPIVRLDSDTSYMRKYS